MSHEKQSLCNDQEKKVGKSPRLKQRTNMSRSHIHSRLELNGIPYFKSHTDCYKHAVVKMPVKRNLCLRSHKHAADVWVCVCVYVRVHTSALHTLSQPNHPPNVCVPGSSATRSTHTLNRRPNHFRCGSQNSLWQCY